MSLKEVLDNKYYLSFNGQPRIKVQWAYNKPVGEWITYYADVEIERNNMRWDAFVEMVKNQAKAFAIGGTLRKSAVSLAQKAGATLYASDPLTEVVS